MRVLLYGTDRVTLDELVGLMGVLPLARVVDVVTDRPTLMNRYGRFGADAVIFDAGSGTVAVIGLVRDLLVTHPEANVLIIGCPSDTASVAATMAAGARGLLTSGASSAEVVAALADIAHTLGFDDHGADGDHRGTPPQLGGRQLQILRGIGNGHTYGEIGRTLMLSELTVQQEARKILRVLGARDKTHGVAQAFRHGLLD